MRPKDMNGSIGAPQTRHFFMLSFLPGFFVRCGCTLSRSVAINWPFPALTRALAWPRAIGFLEQPATELALLRSAVNVWAIPNDKLPHQLQAGGLNHS